MSPLNDNRNARGIGLARGPALILGTILLVAGLYFLYRLHSFPRLSQFPSGRARVEGKAFLGIFGVNGWSGELTAVAGGLLLFGAAQHALAKAMSLIVGIGLGIAAVWALVDHHSGLGLFAANIWTIILWGGSALLLLLNTLMPRRGTAGAAADSAETGSTRTIRVRPTGVSEDGQNSSAVTTDSSTIIPDRGAVRITPTEGTSGTTEQR